MKSLFDQDLRLLRDSGKTDFLNLLGIKKVGCNFAHQLLKNSQDSGLFHVSYTNSGDFNSFFESVCLDFEESLAVEWVILRFPEVSKNFEGLKSILIMLALHERVDIGFEYRVCSSLGWVDNFDAIMIRIRSDGLNVIAWPLLFGPLKFFPETRKANEFCLFFRLKKRHAQYQQLAGANRHHSHLADIPLNHSQEKFDAIWIQTQGKRLLDLEPMYRGCAKARYTAIVPSKSTHEIKEAINHG